MSTYTSVDIKFHKSKIYRVNEYLINNCIFINEKDIKNPIIDYCEIYLKVNFDVEIIQYIRGLDGGSYFDEEFQRLNVEYLNNNKVKYGSIFLKIENKNDYFEYSFHNHTSRMAHSFNKSSELKKWFLELCKYCDAETGIRYYENQYYELFWMHPQEYSLQIDCDFMGNYYNSTSKADLLEAIIEFANYAYIFSNQYLKLNNPIDDSDSDYL